MNVLDRYLQELSSERNYVIRPSPIHGKGAFALRDFNKGQFINTHMNPNEDITEFGRYLNHSYKPNARSKKNDDYSYETYAEKDIKKGDEITLDYRVNKDLEQPRVGWD